MLSNIQEIIERSLFISIRDVLVDNGYVPDIDDFNLDTEIVNTIENQVKNYEDALLDIKNEKGFAIEIFNYSSNESKGYLKVPRIVVDTQSIQPGTLGGDTIPIYELINGIYKKKKNPGLTSDYFFNIYLVANNVIQMRTIIAVLAQALPKRGYIKSYLENNLLTQGNFFIRYLSSGDSPNLQQGVMEKYYNFEIEDVFESLPKEINTIVAGQLFNIKPITEIDIIPNVT